MADITLPATDSRNTPWAVIARNGGTIPRLAGGADDPPPPEPVKPEGDAKPPEAKPDPEKPAGDGEDALAEAGKRALAAERKARRDAEKAREEAERRIKEFEDKDKSDLERAQAAAQDATSRAEKAERDLAERQRRLDQLEIAADKGLKSSLARRLTGTTREEMEADADQLLEDLGDAAKAATAPAPDGAAKDPDGRNGRKPQGSGGDGGATPTTPSHDALLAATQARLGIKPTGTT